MRKPRPIRVRALRGGYDNERYRRPGDVFLVTGELPSWVERVQPEVLPAPVIARERPPCSKAPKGWRCTGYEGHGGPCAAVKLPGFWSRLFGGGR